MNQFVPQLMLGNVLANSSNFPEYNPQWLVLDKWHIGAQYFMGLPGNSSITGSNNDDDWIAKAATGKLVQVEPGEVIETSFELMEIYNNNQADSDDAIQGDGIRWEWSLRIGVVGAHPTRWSHVVASQPFMGLVPNTSWQDDIYQNITVGACLENYDMESAANFPPSWQITMDIITSSSTTPTTSTRTKNNLGVITAGTAAAHRTTQSSSSISERMVRRQHQQPPRFSWDEWGVNGGQKCPWMPQSTLASVEGSTWQRVTWNATLPLSLLPKEENNKLLIDAIREMR